MARFRQHLENTELIRCKLVRRACISKCSKDDLLAYCTLCWIDVDVSSQGNGAIIQDDKTATTELCKVYCAVKYNQSYRGVGSGDRQSSKSVRFTDPCTSMYQKFLGNIKLLDAARKVHKYCRWTSPILVSCIIFQRFI